MREGDVVTVRDAFTVAVPACADESGLRETLDSLYASAARVGLPYDFVIGVNGPEAAAETPAAAVAGAGAFAAAANLEVLPVDGGTAVLPAPGEAPRVVVLRLPVRSKVAAWNAIRALVSTPRIIFADADVRVGPDAMALLLACFDRDPTVTIAAAREEATLAANDGLVARAAALPYRFDFSNVPGRFYALRAAGIPDPMPAHVLAEDAYLTVLVGPSRLVKDRAAVVYLRPPTTWQDYLDQRVRCEVGKLQLAREFATLSQRHGFGRYPWAAFVRAIAPREYPLVVVSLAVRILARLRALWEVRHGFPTGWHVLPSTKTWVPDAVPRADTGSRGH